MTPSPDAQLSASSSPLPGQGVEVPRLFHFDLPPLSQTGQPFLINSGVTTQQEIEQVYQQMLSEMQSDDFCAGAFSMTVWGNKP